MKEEGHLKKSTKLGLLGLLTGAGIAGSFAALGRALYEQAMRPGPRDPAWDETDPLLYREGRAWAEAGEGFREAEIQSVDGLKLWGAYLPAEKRTHRWAICVHGFHDDHASMGIFAKRYHEAGWNTLMPDQRGFGNSEGDRIGWGWDERLDLVGWISWVVRRDPEAEILLHGVSMGAATVLLATGGALPENVKAAVSDCSYTDIESEMRFVVHTRGPGGERLLGLPSRVAFDTLRHTTRRRTGFDLRNASPLQAVERSKTPTLFIHGVEDDLVPPSMMGRLFRAAKCPKSFLWVPGAGHAVEAGVSPELYWGSVRTFLDSYMG